MEGAGSRLGRGSASRPPPPATSKLFSGPVRKWKKKWVHVSSPHSNKHTRSHIKPSRLSLCRWTPISEEEQPRRKVSYAPIVVLDNQKRELDDEFGDGAKTIEAYHYQSTAFPTFRSDDAIHEKHVIAEISMRGENHQESNHGLLARQTSQRSHFDIDLFFTPNSDDYNTFGEI